MAEKRSKRAQQLQLKADFFPMTVLKLQSIDIPAISKELTHIQTTAPNYFNDSPIVIDVSHINSQQSLNLKQLRQTLSEFNMTPVGIRGLDEALKNDANDQGLAILNEAKPAKKPTKTTKTTATPTYTATKVITKPIRAGTQVYAKDGDLIIMAAVNAGAECIADGNIHIYGPLRGRAIAGATGNPNAHIFCKQLDAELISIAGRYLVKDHIQVPKTKQPMLHIYVQDDQLNIEGI